MSDDASGKKPEPNINIQIDREHYQLHVTTMTGAQLRSVPPAPIPPTRDLFQVVPGGQDLKIEDSTVVELKSGMRFITAPAQINPGCA